MFLSIRSKLFTVIQLFTTVSISLFIVTLFILAAQKHDAVVINLAGRQRMSTQKMSKHVFEIISGVETSAGSLEKTKQMNKAVKLYEKVANENIDLLILFLYVGIAIESLIFILSVVFIQINIINPISNLTNKAKIFGSGNLDVDFGLDRNDELGILSNAVNSIKNSP